MVHQSAGGRHHDLRVLFQGVDLRLHRLSPVHRHDGKPGDVFPQLLQFLGDLQAKLAGGAEDDPLHIALFRPDALDHRHTEGAGLAGAGGCLRNDLLPGQQLRDRLLLDLGHLGKAHFGNRFFHFLPDGQFAVIRYHALLPFPLLALCSSPPGGAARFGSAETHGLCPCRPPGGRAGLRPRSGFSAFCLSGQYYSTNPPLFQCSCANSPRHAPQRSMG